MSKYVWIILYDFVFLPFLSLLFLFACLFRSKARETLKIHIQSALRWNAFLARASGAASGKYIYWFHVSSVGEFLQATPVIKSLKNQDSPKPVFIVVTYFSPSLSKFLRAKNKTASYWGYDEIEVFPWDFSFFTKKLINILKPRALVLTKFDIWPNMIFESHKRHIPVFLVSGTFSKNSLRRYLRSFYKHTFNCFKEIFCVSESDRKELLKFWDSAPLSPQIHVFGDTRLDSVIEQSAAWLQPPKNHPPSETFRQITLLCQKNGTQNETLVCGSLWAPDLKALCYWLEESRNPIRHFKNILIAPHEINKQTLKHFYNSLLEVGFKGEFSPDAPYLQLSQESRPKQILLVNSLGILSGLYNLGSTAFVGTGPGGVHNTLEPAVFGNAIICGPRHWNAPEVSDLIRLGGAYAFENEIDFATYLNNLSLNPDLIHLMGQKAKHYTEHHAGSSKKCAIKIFHDNSAVEI